MWTDTPVWFRLWLVLCLVLGIAAASYTWSKCGARALVLGNGAFAAAATGMCD